MKPDAKRKLAAAIDPEDVRTSHYRVCRALQHQWQHNEPHYDPTTNMVVVVSNCTHCTAVRTKRIDMWGANDKRGMDYKYPEGYLANAKQGRPARPLQSWRKDFVMDIVNHADLAVKAKAH